MEHLGSAAQFLGACFVWTSGLLIVIGNSKRFNLRWGRVIVLYMWHTIFSIVYLAYTLDVGGDALVYFDVASASDADFSFGTSAVTLLTRIFVHYFGFSLVATFLVYNIFGAIGLIGFDASLKEVNKNKPRLTYLIVTLLSFLPSISFWSAAIGKDAIAFMATGLALWAAMDFNRRIRLVIFAILAMLVVRPHIAGIMVIAIAGSVVIHSKMGVLKKTAVFSISVAALAAVVPFALKYAGLNDLSNLDAVDEYVSRRQSYNQDGGGGIDLSTMSPPMQLFTYLFRPLPFEAHSLMSLAASFDNVILLLIFLLGLKGFVFNRKSGISNKQINWSFLWIYSGITWIVLGITTANLGISVRQKWMFLPMMLVLMISMMPRKKAMQAAWSDRGSVAYRGSLK